jgi:hypothetical protein
LSGPEFEFLFNTKGKVIDSLYSTIQPNLTSSEAVREVNDILKEIERNQAILKAGNTSLSYRLSMEYVAANKREKSARAYADSLLMEQRKLSERERVLSFLRYGNRPSYFVNGMPVDSDIADKLITGDVVKREIKTNSSNPNGEIWLVLTDRAMRRLRLPTGNEGVYNPAGGNLPDDFVPEIWDRRSSEPAIKIDNVPETAVDSKEDVDQPLSQPQEKPRTVVRSRTINNQPVEVRNN